MDFGRPLIYTPGIVSKSGIRLVPENHLGTDPLNVQCCQAANEAAIDLLLGGNNNRLVYVCVLLYVKKKVKKKI